MKLGKKELMFRVYDNMHQEMREFRTTMSKLIFGLGAVFLAFAGLLITNENIIITMEKRILASSLVVAFSFLVICITRVLEKYFLDIAMVINQFDRLFGLHDVDTYIQNEAVFPSHWQNFGSQNWREPVFQAAYWLSLVFGLLAIACVWII